MHHPSLPLQIVHREDLRRLFDAWGGPYHDLLLLWETPGHRLGYAGDGGAQRNNHLSLLKNAGSFLPFQTGIRKIRVFVRFVFRT